MNNPSSVTIDESRFFPIFYDSKKRDYFKSEQPPTQH